MKIVLVIIILIALVFTFRHIESSNSNSQILKDSSSPATSSLSQTAPIVDTNVCSTNKASEMITVSISKRHMWACNGFTEVYNSAVITGMENFPADLTPDGTYKIYAKITKLYLNGSDSTGSWHDYVNYWLPFLHNQYGTYGFHDATWRANSDFGNISPYSTEASHGCVELPLSTAKWLYNWAQVGTTLTIQS